jgi:probable rRNA maturation factor
LKVLPHLHVHAMPVSLQIESRNPEIKRHAQSLLLFARKARVATGLKGTVSILVESNAAMRAMNRYFRRKDKPTDVLSFPAAAEVAKLHSGDIAISADIAAANAKSLHHKLQDEVKILILHGMLHLAGFDHDADSGEMAAAEKALRSKLRLPLSLTERAASSGQKPALRTRTARIKSAGAKKQKPSPTPSR